MGVIYKLKQEVVDYIVNQKRDFPKISVRQLALVVTEKFQIPVSKSSVNTILKTTHLSSPVGRRPIGQIKKRTYKIPKEKKKQLQNDLEKVQPGMLSSDEKKELYGSEVQTQQIFKPETMNIYQLEEQESLVQGKKFQKPEKIAYETEAKPKEIAKIQTAYAGRPLDGMGCIFLQAAQWDLYGSSLLGKYLRKLKISLMNMSFDQAGDALLYMQPFGIKQVKEILNYKKEGLWALSGLTERTFHNREGRAGEPDADALIRLFVELESRKNFPQNLAHDVPPLFTEVHHIKFILDDGSEIYSDGQLSYLGSQPLPNPLPASLNKALTLLSKLIIVNTHPAVFHNDPSRPRFSQCFYQIMAAFTNSSGRKLRTTVLYDHRMQELAEFVCFPEKRRIFVCVAWAWQQEFKDLCQQENKPVAISWHDEIWDRQVFYSEITTSYFHSYFAQEVSLFRVIFLRDSEKGSPHLALITNALEEDKSAEEILEDYFFLCESGLKGKGEAFIDLNEHTWPVVNWEDIAENFNPNTVNELRQHIRSLLDVLHMYAVYHFYPYDYRTLSIQAIWERFYCLKGYLLEMDRYLCVELVPPGNNFIHFNKLQYSCDRLNASHILDPTGRRLIVRIRPDASLSSPKMSNDL